MKKIFLQLLMLFFCLQVMSQEKGSHLTIYGGFGPTGITYKLENVSFAEQTKCEIKLGGQAGLAYSYFFTKNVGLSLGIGVAHYKTQGKLLGDFNKDNYLRLGTYTDNDGFLHPTDYDLRVRTKDWVECQTGKFLEIPLSVYLQNKFGEKKIFGLYLNAGVKFLIPVSTKYSILDGDSENNAKMNVSGYYKEKNLELGRFDNPDLAQLGFGKIRNPSQILNNTSGNLNLKCNISLMGEAGILISLSCRVAISLGAYIDYGLLNMRKVKRNSAIFTGPETDYVSGAAAGNVGRGITYNSIINCEYVNKVKTFSYGGKIGVRIKLGKLFLL